MRTLAILGAFSLALALLPAQRALPASVSEEDESQGLVDCNTVSRNHNPDLAGSYDRLLCFKAYVSNFDTADDDDGDG